MTIIWGMVFSSTLGLDVEKIVDDFCIVDKQFIRIEGITDNPSDEYSGYTKINNQEFKKMHEAGDLFLVCDYLNQKYGCKKEDIEKSIDEGKIPIIVLPSSVINNFNSQCDIGNSLFQNGNRFIFIYIDCIDDKLIRSLKNEVYSKIRINDRELRKKFTYCIDYEDDSINELLFTLWNNQNIGGILSHRQIQLMITNGMLMKKAITDNISGASYDLCLGDELFYAGKIRYLTEENPFHLIEPYDYVIVTSREEAKLPRDICARFGLSIGLFFQGLILSNGPQIDPGFEGPLFSLLFNTSSSPVLLKRGQHYATIEFNKLIEPTYCYKGVHQGEKLLHYLPTNASRGAINELKKEVNKLNKSNSNLQSTTWAILSFILAIIAIWVSLAS